LVKCPLLLDTKAVMQTPLPLQADPPASASLRKSRVRTGLLMGALFLTVMALGGWYWMAFVVVGCWLGFNEFCQLMHAKGYQPSRLIYTMAAVGFFPLAALQQNKYFAPMLAAVVLFSFFRLLFRKPLASIGDIGATLMGILYVAYLPMHFILLRNLGSNFQLPFYQQSGFRFVLMTSLVIAASDIAAYYAGKRYGKHLLYPAVSPKKTKEGSVVGTLAGIVVGIGFTWWLQLPFIHGVILSGLLTVVAQLGDLSESLIKRDAGLKDSGGLLAGHGGLLDRMDSYIFCGVVAYYYIYWIILQEGLAKDMQHLLTAACHGC
jgi:phosphatidate cytidylyltransferase